MTGGEPQFYWTGGTMSPDAPCYVERQADTELFDGLVRGEFCYVLTSRQMGKSSLMARTAARLREERTATVVIDLTAVGQNLTAEQWYDGLLDQVGRQLRLDEELEAFWLEHGRMAPLARWMAALHEVVLARCPGRIVIFIDEIDSVRSLPFSTDEFFAAIRACYNRRSEDPEFRRLTFCLLGVATPADLIRDTRTTPFNIGRRIELNDFSEKEAAPLHIGLVLGPPETMGRSEGEARALLQRILYWTGGHPYLTQRLCQEVADADAAHPKSKFENPKSIDRLCEHLFLSHQAQERDDNLLFVRDRLLRSEADRASLLDLYGQVRDGNRVPVNDTNPLVSILRLSGIARVVDGCFCVRNRIYERVFDRKWVQAHMPEAEIRRQTAAYRRGLLRTAQVAGGIVAVMAGLMAWEHHSAPKIPMEKAGVPMQRIEGWRRETPPSIKLQQTVEGKDPATAVAVQPDGTVWATASKDGTVQLWETANGKAHGPLLQHRGGVTSLAFNRNGLLATGSADGTARLWTVATGKAAGQPLRHDGPVTSVAFSEDGRFLATGSADGTARLWDVEKGRLLGRPLHHPHPLAMVALSPDAKLLATASTAKTARLWDLTTGKEQELPRDFRQPATSVAFLANGKLVVTGGAKTAWIWDTDGKGQSRKIVPRDLDEGMIAHVLSPDLGLAAAASGRSARLWAADSGSPYGHPLQHESAVKTVAFGEGSRLLATLSQKGIARLWDLRAPPPAAAKPAPAPPAQTNGSVALLACTALAIILLGGVAIFVRRRHHLPRGYRPG